MYNTIYLFIIKEVFLMREFQLVELEGHPNILFSAAFVFPDTLFKFQGGQNLAFYEIYEFMPIVPPLDPIIRAIYDKGKAYPIEVDFVKEKVSFNLKKEGSEVNKFCNILVEDMNELLIQLDLYLMYHSIGIDLKEIKENIKSIFKDEKEIEINNLISEKKEKFSLILKQYKGKVLFVLRKEI